MPLLDTATARGRRLAQRLQEETHAWLVTVTPDARPQPSLVWFLWRDPDVLLYSQPDRPKLRNVEANPRVALHFGEDGNGGDVAIFEGTAEVDASLPRADAVPEYVAKYREAISRLGWTPESFAADYSVPVRIRLLRARGW
jgi:PPOX class probable F420-dependent enzyme